MYTSSAWWWSIVRRSVIYFFSSRASRLGAAISFYAILALPPLVMVSTFILRLLFGESSSDVYMNIQAQMSAFIGSSAVEFIHTIATQVNWDGEKGWTTLIAVIASLFSASGIFTLLQASFNEIWSVRSKRDGGNRVLHFVKTRLVSILIIICIGVLTLLGLIGDAFIEFLGDRLYILFPSSSTQLIYWLNLGFSYGVFILIFGALFKFIPDRQILWRQVWFAALITTLLFGLGRFGIASYLTSSSMLHSYGVAGSFVLILLWVFYSSQILLLGASLSRAWSEAKGYSSPAMYYARIIEVREVETEY